LVEWDGKLYPVVRRCSLSMEDYVEMEVEVTRTTLGGDDPERLARTERQARWRYAGWQAGKIRGL
jgi:hypothetical protein